MNKSKVIILLVIVGLVLIIISIGLGFSENFNSGRGGILLCMGVEILSIGIAFMPKIWRGIAYITDFVSMFISGLR